MGKSERAIIVLYYLPMASTKCRSSFQLANWANKCMNIFLHVARCMTESHDKWLPWACFRTMDCSSIWIVRVTSYDQRRCGLYSSAVNLNSSIHSVNYCHTQRAVESNRGVPKRSSQGHIVIDTSPNKRFPANRMSSNDYYYAFGYVYTIDYHRSCSTRKMLALCIQKRISKTHCHKYIYSQSANKNRNGVSEYGWWWRVWKLNNTNSCTSAVAVATTHRKPLST